MSSELNILMEMGFSEQRAKKALEVCGNRSVETAMEWLLAHPDEPMDTDDTALSPVQTPAAKGDSTDKDMSKQEAQQPSDGADSETPGASKHLAEVVQDATELPKCIKCDECGRKLRTDAEVEFHAVKSGHQSFSESTEEIKPLTEEEKLEKKKKLEEVIRQRRVEREEREKKEAIEKEKSRRKVGQEVAQTRQKMEEEEMRKIAEEKKREKLEAKLARQKVLEDIERDKQARRQKFNMDPLPPKEPEPAPVPEPVEPQRDYTECKLQIRLTDGQTLSHTFGALEQLSAVRLYVELNRTDGEAPFALMTPFPRKVFVGEDYDMRLVDLGLVPSAVLVLTKSQ